MCTRACCPHVRMRGGRPSGFSTCAIIYSVSARGRPRQHFPHFLNSSYTGFLCFSLSGQRLQGTVKTLIGSLCSCLKGGGGDDTFFEWGWGSPISGIRVQSSGPVCLPQDGVVGYPVLCSEHTGRKLPCHSQSHQVVPISPNSSCAASPGKAGAPLPPYFAS